LLLSTMIVTPQHLPTLLDTPARAAAIAPTPAPLLLLLLVLVLVLVLVLLLLSLQPFRELRSRLPIDFCKIPSAN